MSEHEKNQQIKDGLSGKLSGEALKNALDFVAYMNENEMTLDISYVSNGAYSFKRFDELVCILAVSPFWGIVSGWSVYLGIGNNTIFNGNYDDIAVDEHLKELVWTHIKSCANSVGDKCGGGCQPDKPIKVFGKEFNKQCSHLTKFENPNADTVKKISDLAKLFKHCIDDARSIQALSADTQLNP